MLHTVKRYWLGGTEGKHPAANGRPKLAPPSRFEHAETSRALRKCERGASAC